MVTMTLINKAYPWSSLTVWHDTHLNAIVVSSQSATVAIQQSVIVSWWCWGFVAVDMWCFFVDNTGTMAACLHCSKCMDITHTHATQQTDNVLFQWPVWKLSSYGLFINYMVGRASIMGGLNCLGLIWGWSNIFGTLFTRWNIFGTLFTRWNIFGTLFTRSNIFGTLFTGSNIFGTLFTRWNMFHTSCWVACSSWYIFSKITAMLHLFPHVYAILYPSYSSLCITVFNNCVL